MAQTEIGCRIFPCKFVKNKADLYDPNSPTPQHRHCWCKPIPPFDPIKWILLYPFYKHGFRIFPIGEEYFTERILLHLKQGRPILSESWLGIYRYNTNTHICRSTTYDQRKPHDLEELKSHIGTINLWNMRVVYSLYRLNVVLFYCIPFASDETITEDFSTARDVPLSIARVHLWCPNNTQFKGPLWN